MFQRPTKTPGSVAIMGIDRLVRAFLFEGQIDHLLEIGNCMSVDDVEALSDAVDKMCDHDVHAWSTWLFQAKPSRAAHLLRVHLL